MGDLNVFAELKLSFSLLLTNVLQVDATLHQLHGDKTSSASIAFEGGEFLVSRVLCCILIFSMNTNCESMAYVAVSMCGCGQYHCAGLSGCIKQRENSAPFGRPGGGVVC